MLGYVRTRGRLDASGLVLWTEEDAQVWKAGAGELSADLETLGVPHLGTITSLCQPPWRSARTKLPRARWVKLWIGWDDLPALVRWLPSLGKRAEVISAEERQPMPDVAVMIRKADGEVFFGLRGFPGERLVWTSDGQQTVETPAPSRSVRREAQRGAR
jgi:hypothetical protein